MATSKSRRTIKKRLLQAGLLENRCDYCGLEEWMGEPLVVQIDHVNGNRADHRLENLRMLCPNCHSQTETHCRRPKREARLHGA
ncbi:MAG: HNH endonuclease [Candidatus Eremiobacteraeota bacterium]|nr:HNH endonuclease [Candidatus Eremiobacteraeota bacterium]MBV8582448.1 HNH endonuclease [Candidatus Eremiobacteraeota bacterium]